MPAEHWLLSLGNAALTYRRVEAAPRRPGRRRLDCVTRESLAKLLGHESGIAAAIASGLEQGDVQVRGDTSRVAELMAMLDEFDPMFNIVEP